MVSPNTSADDASSGSMEDNEKRFYNKTTPVRHAPPPTSASESESESQSENGNPVLSSPPQKKPQPIPTSRNVAASVTQKPSTSAKRSRDEEQSRSLEKRKKAKEVKKTTPLETPKTSERKPSKPLETPTTSERKPSKDKKMVKKSDSQTKSARRNGPVWNNQDEIEFVKGVVAYQVSKGLPKTNLTPVYEYIRNLNVLEHEYSSTQMYDKLRRLKMKFAGLKDKKNAGDFTFRTPHDEAIYKLGKRLWGAGEEEEEESSDEEDEKNGDEGAEEEGKKGKGQDVEEDRKEGKGQHDVEMALKENEEEEEDEDDDEVVVREGNSKQKQNPSFVTRGAGKLFDLLQEKNLAMMNEFKHDLARENQEMRKETMEMVREALRSSVSTGTSHSVQFSGDEMLKKMSTSSDLPKLEKADADRFEHKWQKQHFIELDASSKRLQLLQEECQFRMEKLGPLLKEDNP